MMLESIRKLYESSHLDDYKWTLATDEVICVLGPGPDDPDAVNWGDQWRKIAAEIEAEITENFMKLPIGRDGQPIHIGDELVNDTCTRRATVIGVGAREFFFNEEGRIKKNRADCWTHVKPDPLRERAKEFLRDYRGLNLKSPDAKLEAILDAFCADVRKLMEVDA